MSRYVFCGSRRWKHRGPIRKLLKDLPKEAVVVVGGARGADTVAEDFSRYSTAALLVTWAFGLVLNGFVAPVVEELYFRGYLLPRTSRLGAWAPLVNTVLFSLFHFFTPRQNAGRARR